MNAKLPVFVRPSYIMDFALNILQRQNEDFDRLMNVGFHLHLLRCLYVVYMTFVERHMTLGLR
jgi:hypothetical protein